MAQKKKEVDYRSFLFLGISLISVGLILASIINYAFISILAAGLCLIAIALANREKLGESNKKKNHNK